MNTDAYSYRISRKNLVFPFVREKWFEPFIECLVAEGFPVSKEQDFLYESLVHQDFDNGHSHTGLSCTGRHDNECFAVPFLQMFNNPLDALNSLLTDQRWMCQLLREMMHPASSGT